MRLRWHKYSGNNMILLAVAAALATTASPTVPSFESGNSIYSSCAGTGTHYTACLGYITGVADTYLYLQVTRRLPQMICFPLGVTQGQIVDTVVRFLVDHPESRHTTASSLVRDALKSAFPC